MISHHVFETSTLGVDALLPEQYLAAMKSNAEYHVWLHFGVDGTADRFSLECQAVNDATFRGGGAINQFLRCMRWVTAFPSP